MLAYSDESTLAAFKEVSRQVTGYVDVMNETGTEVSRSFLPDDTLASIKIEYSVPGGKFFGFTINRKMTIELIEKIEITKGTILKPCIKTVDGEEPKLPYFYVETVTVNDTNNTTTITAYDGMSLLEHRTIGDLEIEYPTTLSALATYIANSMGYAAIVDFTGVDLELTDTTVNLEGTETLKEVMEAIAAATGTFCFCTSNLLSSRIFRFRCLHNTANDDTINRDSYFEFKAEEGIELTQIASATQLGDNYITGEEGYCQVIWDNPFLELREDVAALVDAIAARTIGVLAYPYEFTSRGNPFYEPGDAIWVQRKDGAVQGIYYFNETLEYKGGLRSTTSWKAQEEDKVEGNPTNLGDSLKQTFARVDKVNKQIELVAGKADTNAAEISSLKINTDSIAATVEKVQETTEKALETVNSDMNTLTQKVESTITPDQVNLQISEALSNGVDSVTTSTGFTFNKDGLTVSKSGSEMTTQITEDGMKVYRDSTAMLTANNEGVKAANLHATTFLIIGNTSRFEDYGSRTGCFWIGG